MNDYWNNPTEDFGVPECESCGADMTINQDGSATCPECGFHICAKCNPHDIGAPEDEQGLENIEDFVTPPPPGRCPHGQPWAECDPCMVTSDMAYDAKRGS